MRAWPAMVARRWARAALILLCAFAAGAALWQAADDAPTTDEPLYVTDGLAALLRHDLRVNPQHPPLAKALAAVPVLAAHPALPPGFGRLPPRRYSRAFLDLLARRGQMREVTFLARLVPVLELVVRVDGHKRTLMLPPALGDYQPRGAALRDGALQVTFDAPRAG